MDGHHNGMVGARAPLCIWGPQATAHRMTALVQIAEAPLESVLGVVSSAASAPSEKAREGRKEERQQKTDVP